MKNRFAWQYILLFGALWGCSYLIFPSWYLPISLLGRFLVFSFFLIYFSFNGWLLYRWIGDIDGPLISLRSGRIKDIIKQHFPLLLILGLAVILHLYPMTLPIETAGDEHYHAYVSVPILKKIFPLTHLPVPFLGWLAILLLYLLKRIRIKKFLIEKIKIKVRPLSKITFSLILLYLYFYLLNSSGLLEHLGPAKHLFRFPPLGKTANLIIYGLFGVGEFTARLPQLIFALLSAVYLYRLLLLFRNRMSALWGSSLLLFLPAFFYFGNMAYLTCGEIFFVLASTFHFLRYIKEEKIRDLILALFFVSSGFLYKRVLLVLLFAFGIYLLLKERNFKRIKIYLQLTWISLVGIIPWLIICYKYSERNYFFLFSNWTSLNIVTWSFRQIPKATTYLIFLLFLAGIIYGLAKRRDELTIFSLLWFFIYYIFITGDSCRAIRLTLPFYPAIVIIVSQLLGDAVFRWKRIGLFLYISFLIYLLLASTLTSFPPLENKYTLRENVKIGYLPYPQVMKYIKENIPPGTKILAPMGCEPSHFYLSLYNMEDKYTWHRKIWVKNKEEQTIDNLYEFGVKNNFDYLVFPRGHWSSPWIKTELIKRLFAEDDRRFALVKIFRYGDNEIGLWNIKR